MRKRAGRLHAAIFASLDWLDAHAERLFWIILIVGGALVALIYLGR